MNANEKFIKLTIEKKYIMKSNKNKRQQNNICNICARTNIYKTNGNLKLNSKLKVELPDKTFATIICFKLRKHYIFIRK